MLECTRCKTHYPDDYENRWGSDGLGDGYGSTAICTALVKDKPEQIDSALHVCRGRLSFAEGAEEDEQRITLGPAAERISTPGPFPQEKPEEE